MAKIIDITDKLSFEENPILLVKGKKLEVNADAPTMLKVMGLMSKESPGIDGIKAAYEMLFEGKARKDIEKLGLKVPDWIVLVQEAVSLVAGESDNQGE